MKARIVEVTRSDFRETEVKPELLEPFFRSRAEANRIRQTQTSAERRKFADAFALVGCVRCQSKDRPHQGCGFCTTCYRWYTNVLRGVLLARKKGEIE